MRLQAPATLTAVKNIVILASGRGSNMQAIVQAAEREQWPARVACVVANRPDAQVLPAARALGVPAVLVDHTAYPSRDAFDEALAAQIDAHQPALVLLAGFMRVLSDAFVQRYDGRLMNIHPSLLPSFPGLKAHERALQAGVKVHGATVHFVTSQLDHGPIVAQAAVPVQPDDTPPTLAARVQQAEHRLYPLAAGWFVRDLLRIEQGIVRVQGNPAQLI